MNNGGLRRRQALVQALAGKFIHQKAHEAMQHLQHQPVPAQGDNDIGIIGTRIAIGGGKVGPRALGLRRAGGQECQALVSRKCWAGR